MTTTKAAATKRRIRTPVISPALALTALLGIATNATAAPILFNDGWLDGTLRLYDFNTNGAEFIDDVVITDLVLRRDYELGVDFFPAVPLSYQLNRLPYTDCVNNPFTLPSVGGRPACLTSLWMNFTAPLTYVDGCSPVPLTGFAEISALIVQRGGSCTFYDRWALAEAQGHEALIVANNAPGAPGPVGGVPAGAEPTIPLFRVTDDVGFELLHSSRSINQVGWGYNPLLEMRVSWTPIVTPVPVSEPSGLALFAGALLALVSLGRRKRQTAA